MKRILSFSAVIVLIVALFLIAGCSGSDVTKSFDNAAYHVVQKRIKAVIANSFENGEEESPVVPSHTSLEGAYEFTTKGKCLDFQNKFDINNTKSHIDIVFADAVSNTDVYFIVTGVNENNGCVVSGVVMDKGTGISNTILLYASADTELFPIPESISASWFAMGNNMTKTKIKSDGNIVIKKYRTTLFGYNGSDVDSNNPLDISDISTFVCKTSKFKIKSTDESPLACDILKFTVKPLVPNNL